VRAVQAESSATHASAPSPRSGGRGAALVAAGILASRLFGLVRERIFAHYLGNSSAAAAFKAALRIPNFLQNLFGEGVLSASFIPVYARLLGEKRDQEADEVAGAVLGLLAAAAALLVAVGVAATPAFIDLIAPGFQGETRHLTIQLVRILFPGAGLLVLSAWCLGILNSHRRFLVSYSAPVLWNLAIVAALVASGRRASLDRIAQNAAWGAVLGSLLQLGVQIRPVLRLLGRFRISLSLASSHVRQVARNFVPVVIGRGVVQVSAYLDVVYASLVSERAVAALAYAQTLYLIPVSLFGMAVSAAELPEMARTTGEGEELAARLRVRIDGGLARIAFFVIPSAACFFLLGDVVSGALLQTGRFGTADTRYLWYLLMGSAIGLVAATQGRLYASAFYALKDARTPLVFAVIRVVLTAALAYWSALYLPGELGVPRPMGAVGIVATTGAAAWIEFLLLQRGLRRRIGRTGLSVSLSARLWGAALLATGAGLTVKMALVHRFGPAVGGALEWGGQLLPMPRLHPVLTAAVVLLPAGGIYVAATVLLRVPEAASLVRRFTRRR
jgi:putative peptidoglycan lipid II flippase